MKIGIVGFNGKLGNAVLESINNDDSFSVGFGVSRSFNNGDLVKGIKVFNSLRSSEGEIDGIIDFSHKDNIEDVLNYGLEKNIPIVIGTTGFDENQEKLIEEAAKKIPILLSHNTGLGINVLLDIVKEAVSMLNGFDIEIIEKHHNRKPDAPSGTSKMIFNSMLEANPNLYTKLGREGSQSKREKDEVGIHSIRGGTIISDHDVIFAGKDEVITISHHAESDRSFANGALKAMKFLNKKENGLYEMKEVLSND